MDGHIRQEDTWGLSMVEKASRFVGAKDLLKAEIGHEIKPVDMTITEELVERNAWANDDYNPWYMRDSPFGGRIASPTLLAYETDIMIWNHFALPEGGGIWAKQAFEFLNPLKVGSKVKITGHLVDRQRKKGRDHITFEFLVADEKGLEIVRMKSAHAFPLVARAEDRRREGE